MSTYLELVQELGTECGISGTGPSTVTGQSGELARLVLWIKDAYVEIQNRSGGRWDWLRSEFTLNTTASDDNYSFGDATDSIDAATITRFSSWRLSDYRSPPRIYLTSAGVGGETWMTWTNYDYWKNVYEIGTQNDGHSIHITVDPRDKIRLGPKPDADYTITGEYFKSAQILADDSDTPEMPTQFHKLIIYRAMEKYAAFESAPEVMERAEREGGRLMRQLEVNQKPFIRKARTLA